MLSRPGVPSRRSSLVRACWLAPVLPGRRWPWPRVAFEGLPKPPRFSEKKLASGLANWQDILLSGPWLSPERDRRERFVDLGSFWRRDMAFKRFVGVLAVVAVAGVAQADITDPAL